MKWPHASLLMLASLSLTQGCVLEWIDYFGNLTTLGSAGDEHRVRDLRVLAVEVDPPELRYPLRAFEGGDLDVALRVEPFAYDPRGGEVDTSLQVCVRALASLDRAFGPLEPVSPSVCLDEQRLAGSAPDVIASLLPEERTVSSDAAARGGRLLGLEHTLRFDAPALKALAALAGQPGGGLRGFELVVALTVSRVWLGEPEVEQALLSIPVRPELLEGADPALLAALLEREQAEICDPDLPRDCIDPAFLPRGDDEGPRPGPTECGDGFLQAPEQCDPPAPGSCTEECQLENVCERTCVYRVPPNTRPRVYGLERVEGVFEGQPMRFTPVDDATLRDGDRVRLAPGDALALGAVVDEAAQERASAAYGPELYQEVLESRWYVFGDGGDLGAPVGLDGRFVGQGYTGAVRYQSLPEGHAPGDREPFVLVVSDGRGGMTVTTLELAFE